MRLQPSYVDVRRLRQLLDDGNPREAETLVLSLAPAGLADLLLQLDPIELARLQPVLGRVRLADALAELDPSEAARLIARFTRAIAADILEDMEPDDAPHVVEELEDSQAEGILAEMEQDEARELRQLMTYPADTAGGRMTPEFVSISPTVTVAAAMRLVRTQAPDAETIYYVYVTDQYERLRGVVSLRQLVIADPQARIADVMRRQVFHVRVDTDQEGAARLLAEHDLLAVPVVDEVDRLRGVITVDDVLDVVEQEATEDMYRMAGIGVKEHATSPMLESARRRVPWLAFNMIWSLGSAFIISGFQGTIEAATVLAVFIPVITGQAGNAGIQTATIVIRSLALGEVTPGDTMKVLLREWGVGVIKGGLFGLLLGAIAWVWKGSPVLGLVAGGALFLNIAVVASTTGVIFPMTLRRIGIDPATIAGVFDTMLSDLMGNLIYLGIATLLIRWLI